MQLRLFLNSNRFEFECTHPLLMKKNNLEKIRLNKVSIFSLCKGQFFLTDGIYVR